MGVCYLTLVVSNLDERFSFMIRLRLPFSRLVVFAHTRLVRWPNAHHLNVKFEEREYVKNQLRLIIIKKMGRRARKYWKVDLSNMIFVSWLNTWDARLRMKEHRVWKGKSQIFFNWIFCRMYFEFWDQSWRQRIARYSETATGSTSIYCQS